MFRTNIATKFARAGGTNVICAVGLCLAATIASASAGGLSFESRGYGGPLYVGPNFQQGGQHSVPTYGPKERSTTKRARGASKSRKAPATREADTEKAAPVTEAAEAASIDKAADSENSTISSASVQTDDADTADASDKASDTGASAKAAAAAAPTTCKRYIAAAAKTVTVACD